MSWERRGNALLFIPWPNDPNSSTRDITETKVEASKFVADNNEHAEWFPGVFYFRQEVGTKTERKRDLRWLVEVGLEDMFVEDQEAL